MYIKNFKIDPRAKTNRIGEIKINNQGCKMKIVEYFTNKNITVEFLDEHHGRIENVIYKNFCAGEVVNPYHTQYMNVGYIGEIYYDKNIQLKEEPSYKSWRDMLTRCYGDSKQHPGYEECYVCSEWLNYTNFREWYLKNYYDIPGEKMQLDKDILFKHNHEYCPEKCCFVPSKINHIFANSYASRGSCPIGVSFDKKKKKFEAYVTDNKKRKFLGYFKTPEEAFYVYKQKKEQIIKLIAEKYKNYLPINTYNALINWQIEITD